MKKRTPGGHHSQQKKKKRGIKLYIYIYVYMYMEKCLNIDVVMIHILKTSNYFTFENFLKINFGELVKICDP